MPTAFANKEMSSAKWVAIPGWGDDAAGPARKKERGTNGFESQNR